jgi:cyclophilin family peptidyl-prolyl cis-trans isomerase/HEAT repeat protein
MAEPALQSFDIILRLPKMTTRPAIPLLLLAALVAAKPVPITQKSRIEKMARILELEDRRSVGEGELSRYLSDPDRSVRRRAALAAGRIGDKAIVPALVERMNDPEGEVRQMSAFALGLIGDKGGSERLLASLKDPEPVVRARAAEALGLIGEARAGPEVARVLLESLPQDATRVTVKDDPGNPADPYLLQRLALFALARLKNREAAELALLQGGRSRFDWWAATYTAMRVESPGLKPVLLEAATSRDPLSRALAARGLGALKDPSLVSHLAPLVKDPDPGVVVSALRALAIIADAQAVVPVSQALSSPNTAVIKEALDALAALPSAPQLRASIVALVGHEDPSVRAAALPVLAKLDKSDFALVLSGLDPDPVWFVRAGLATALGQAADEMSLGILYAMLKDEDPRVIPSVLLAIRKARGADARDTLLQHLEHPDLSVRGAAAEGIEALGPIGVVKQLVAAYRRSVSEAELEARLALVGALAAQKGEDALAALREITGSDPSRAVRMKAASAMRAQGQEPPWIGVEPVERPHLDYRSAMAPYDPLPDVPLYTPRVILHTRRGKIEIHLNVVEAPLTSANFMDLARRGFFTGLDFHRVVPGFVVQGGDPRGDGSGGPGYTLRCEIGQRPYGRGGVGMALSGKDTGGSQFFITLSPQPRLDGQYTLFGWVASGMEVVEALRQGDRIERVEVWAGQ